MSIRQYLRIGILGIAALSILWVVGLSVRLAMVSRRVPQPQAVFVLGGGSAREETAAEIAQYYPDLPIWVSSGTRLDQVLPIFEAAGISLDRLHLDYQASDTVTNFTTLVPEFKANNVQHLYLLTSAFHMPRAKAIGTIVLGSQGIVFTPIAIADSPTQEITQEPNSKIARDIARSLLWLVTGRTGEKLQKPLLIPPK